MNLPTHTNHRTTADDEREITALTIRYAWALDSRDYEDLRNVFLSDATARLGRECNGVDDIVVRVTQALDPLDVSQHLVANQQARVNPDGVTGTCRCYFQAQHVRRAAAVDGASPNFIIAGRYLDRVERTADGWRIRRRELMVDWTEGNSAVPIRTGLSPQ
jgi:3-phenylpropionate/cinnamic acid dioxygenase small subunit